MGSYDDETEQRYMRTVHEMKEEETKEVSED
jgi:hypothetical protein